MLTGGKEERTGISGVTFILWELEGFVGGQFLFFCRISGVGVRFGTS